MVYRNLLPSYSYDSYWYYRPAYQSDRVGSSRSGPVRASRVKSVGPGQG